MSAHRIRHRPLAALSPLALAMLANHTTASAQPSASAQASAQQAPSSPTRTATTSSQASPSGQTPTAARTPFPNRANEGLPSWLRLRGEFRERVEGFQGSGFVEGRDDGYALTRVRLNATVTPTPHLSFQANVQDRWTS